MNLSCVKYCSIALASVLLALGLGCGNSEHSGNEPGAPPAKDIPVVNNPAVQYNFYEPKSEQGLINDTNYGYLIAKVRPGFKTAAFERMGFQVMGGMIANGSVYYRLHKDSDVLQALNQARKHLGIMFIEPEINYEHHAVETNPIIFTNLDDNLADKTQYSVYTTKAYDAWLKYGFGDPGVKPIVASVDSGIRWRHEDLVNQVRHAYSWYLPSSPTTWTSHAQLPSGEIPLDGERLLNLLPDFTRSYNGATYYSTDQEGHGTHTSGTMVATGNNGAGVAGICWNNELIHYKGFPSGGNGSTWSIFGSIWHLARWKEANDYKYTIPINFSLGGPSATQFALDMISHGLQNGIVVVASAGNNGSRMAQYPAAFSGVITVGSSTGANIKAKLSNWGPHLSVVAPGDAIISTIPYSANAASADARENASYTAISGTSMAAPHVTGLIGYMLNFNPNLKPDQIKTYIEKNADFIDGKSDFSDEYGWGRINVLKTIEAVINDANNGATPDSAYAINPVKIKAPMNGLNVWLYNCSQDGTIENYVASAITGEYLTGYDPETGLGIENNAAWFNMLRPGRYIAKAYVGAAQRVASTAPFDVTAAMATKEVSLTFDADMLTTQTFYTQDSKTIADLSEYTNACLEVYDSTGALLYEEDQWLMDNLMFPEPLTPGDYYIRIYDYEQDKYAGEYALWFTNGSLWAPADPNDYWELDWGPPSGLQTVPIAPGTFAAPTGGERSEQKGTRAEAQAINQRVIYYGRFNDSAGSSGATGHWYKFTVTAE